MAKIREALQKVADALGLNQKLLERAQRREKAFRKRAYKANAQKEAAQTKADQLRADAQKFLSYDANQDVPKGSRMLTRAARKDKKALRLGHVAFKNHQRKLWWTGKIKELTGRIEGLDKQKADLEAEAKKLNHVTIKGNHATGGSPRERLKAVALKSAANCASGKRPNFYSQSGTFDADHCITGPSYDHRDDCSSWFASVYKSAGLPDPSASNFAAGYTGTLMSNGKRVSNPKPGDAVIYGSFPGHHVEMYVGPGDKTIGHGSSPVDPGTTNLFGDGDYAFYSFLD